MDSLSINLSNQIDLIIKQINQYKPRFDGQISVPVASSLFECFSIIGKLKNLLSDPMFQESKSQIIAAIINLVKQAIEFLKSVPTKEMQKVFGEMLLKIVQECKAIQGGGETSEGSSDNPTIADIGLTEEAGQANIQTSSSNIKGDFLAETNLKELGELEKLLKKISKHGISPSGSFEFKTDEFVSSENSIMRTYKNLNALKPNNSPANER